VYSNDQVKRTVTEQTQASVTSKNFKLDSPKVIVKKFPVNQETFILRKFLDSLKKHFSIHE
jgi:hypothetical protein